MYVSCLPHVTCLTHHTLVSIIVTILGEVLHYVIFSIFLLLHLSKIQIFSAAPLNP